MKFLFLPPLLCLAAVAMVPAAVAQSVAKAKIVAKSPGQPGARVSPSLSAPAPVAFGEMPSDEVINSRADGLTSNMQRNLGLNPQQTEKLRAINRRSVENVESIRAHYRSDPRKMLSMIEDVSSSRLTAIKDVLNASQFDKYQRKREEKMGIPNVHGAQGNAAPGLGGGGE